VSRKMLRPLSKRDMTLY